MTWPISTSFREQLFFRRRSSSLDNEFQPAPEPFGPAEAATRSMSACMNSCPPRDTRKTKLFCTSSLPTDLWVRECKRSRVISQSDSSNPECDPTQAKGLRSLRRRCLTEWRPWCDWTPESLQRDQFRLLPRSFTPKWLLPRWHARDQGVRKTLLDNACEIDLALARPLLPSLPANRSHC